jgi:hypothetical protein
MLKGAILDRPSGGRIHFPESGKVLILEKFLNFGLNEVQPGIINFYHAKNI